MMFWDATANPGAILVGGDHLQLQQHHQQPGTVQLVAIQTIANPILITVPTNTDAAVGEKGIGHGDEDDAAVINALPEPTSPKWTLKKLKEEVLISPSKVLQFAIEKGVIKEDKLCPKCSEPMRIVKDKRLPEGVKFRCRKKGGSEPHDVSRSIRQGTWFQDARLDFDQTMLLSYMWSQRYSQQQVMHELGVSKKTVVEWFYFHREAIEDIIMGESQAIGGPGTIVEIDESKFGKHKNHRGSRRDGTWVFGGVERGSKGSKMFLVPVKKRDSATLIPLIKKWILPGTTIISDCWKAYDVLKEEDFVHLKVNHKLHFKDPETGAHTNTAEGNWAHTKRSLPVSGLKKAFLTGYLAEYIWRKHCRQNKLDSFEEFLRLAAKLYEPDDSHNKDDDTSDEELMGDK